LPLLVEQLNGGLTVASGPGSRFSLRFPAGRAKEMT
jgi:signal transduction histidine kinase